MPDLDILAADFMVRALVAAAATGLAAPAIGTFLVQRRLSLMGDGIGHISVTGVALGLLTGASPTATAVAVAIAGAVTIELIRASGRASGDVALALIFYGGLAGGLMLVSVGGEGVASMNSYLFGSLLSTAPADVWVTVGLATFVVALCLTLLPQLFSVSNDEDFARTSGLPVRFYNVLISVLAAVSVSVAMRTVGLLLVSALLVIPVATAQQFARGFRTTILGAMVAGLLASVIGVAISAFVEVQPGATIVLVAIGGFAVTAPIGMLLQRRRLARVPFEMPEPPEPQAVEENHRHQHGPGCGHVAVEHGDHVDYIHDGHRHAVHGGHYDEH
ncbi:MAG TPA: metal ABC transporter permease [Marmoricola sp.]